MLSNTIGRHYLLVLLVGLVVNWPIFLSDVLVNDDLTLVTSNLLEDYSGLKAVYYGQAKPSGYYFHRALAAITPDGTFAYRVYNFVLIIITAMVFFSILVEAWLLDKKTALVTTFGFLCFPSIGIQPFAIGTLHFVSYLMFFIGVLMAHRYWRGVTGVLGLLLGCVCLVIGARMSSTIPFLYIFLFSFLLAELLKRWHAPSMVQNRLVKGFWLTLLLTVLVVLTFVIEGLFYEQHSWFGGSYNKLKLDWLNLLKDMGSGIKMTYVGQFTKLFDWPVERLSMLTIAALAILLLFYKVKGNVQLQGQDALGTRQRYLFLAFMVILAVVTAILPYALIGKIPKPEGYQSRWAILVGIGGAFTIGLLFELARNARHKVLQFGGLFVTTILLCGLLLSIWDGYGKWERVSHDNKAMIAKLKTLEYQPDIHFYCVNTNIQSEPFYTRRWYDWAFVFDESWKTNRETMGYHRDYCVELGVINDDKLIERVPLIKVVAARLSDMEALTNWMYYGKAREEYHMGRINLIAVDTRIDQLSGTGLVLESLKLKVFGKSELLQGYYDNFTASYDQ